MKENPTLRVLCFFTIFFSFVTLMVVGIWPSDGQTYTVFTGLLTGFAGALIMHLKDKDNKPPDPPGPP